MLFMAAGFVIWASDSDADDPIPPAPAAAPLLMAPQKPPTPPAAPEKSREEKRFARYDDNEGGIITRAEMMGSRRGSWERLADNGDNTLDFERWASLHTEKFPTPEAERSHPKKRR